MTCSNYFMQYVGETAQQLSIRFATHRASMSGKIKSNSCKWLTEHFQQGYVKMPSILHKLLKNGKAIVELVVVPSTLVKQFLGGREKQNGVLN